MVWLQFNVQFKDVALKIVNSYDCESVCMYCTQCGTQILDNVSECPVCHAHVQTPQNNQGQLNQTSVSTVKTSNIQAQQALLQATTPSTVMWICILLAVVVAMALPFVGSITLLKMYCNAGDMVLLLPIVLPVCLLVETVVIFIIYRVLTRKNLQDVRYPCLMLFGKLVLQL